MIDERESLERALERFPAEPGIVDRVYRRRRRKDRNQRIGAGLVTVVVVTAAAVVLANVFSSRSPVPVHPGPSILPTYHHNGDIAVYGVVRSYDRLCARSPSDTAGPVEQGCGIFEVDPATGHEAPLQISGIGATVGDMEATDLTWSPDGMALAYELAGTVSIFHLSTGHSEDIMECAPHRCELAWSPDGTTIAISDGDTIDLVGPDGTEQASLEPLGPGARIGAPAWLPDGRRIAFVGRGSGLYEVDRTGAHLRHLGDIPKRAYAPAFSPDGSRIAYLVLHWGWHGCGAAIDAGGTGACPLTLTVAPTDGSSAGVVRAVGKCACLGINPGLGWSPDGKKLALVTPGLPAVMNAYGIELVPVSVEGAWGDPAWRPVP